MASDLRLFCTFSVMEPITEKVAVRLKPIPETPDKLSFMWSRLKESTIIPDQSPSQRLKPEEVQSRDELTLHHSLPRDVWLRHRLAANGNGSNSFSKLGFTFVCLLSFRLWAPPSSPVLTHQTESPSSSQISHNIIQHSKAQNHITTPTIHLGMFHLEFRSPPIPGFIWAALAMNFKDIWLRLRIPWPLTSVTPG